jgi:hypothetical protein
MWKLTLGYGTIEFGNPICNPWDQCSSMFYQGKDIVFRFIIEYNSLMDFGP